MDGLNLNCAQRWHRFIIPFASSRDDSVGSRPYGHYECSVTDYLTRLRYARSLFALVIIINQLVSTSSKPRRHD